MRSYISSLEQQQISLLNALHELHRRFPTDSKIRNVLGQLEASGFDVRPLEPHNELLRDGDAVRGQSASEGRTDHAAGDNVGLDLDSTCSFNLGPLLAQPEPLDSQTVADFLWSAGDVTTQGIHQDVFFTDPPADLSALLNVDFTSPTDFPTPGGRAGQHLASVSQEMGYDLDRVGSSDGQDAPRAPLAI